MADDAAAADGANNAALADQAAQAAPDPAAPDQQAPDQAAPDQAAPDPAAPDQQAADQQAPDQAAADEAAADLQAAVDAFLLTQKYQQEKFWKYRIGDDTYNKPLWGIEYDYGFNIRKAPLRRIKARQVPRVDYRRLDREAKRVIRAPWAEVFRVFYRQPAQNVAQPGQNQNRRAVGFPDIRQVTGRQEFRRAGRLITAAKRDFAFVKVLGWGGNGMVVLWKWNPRGRPQDGGLDVVMKLSIQRDGDFNIARGDIDEEHRMTSKFVRAPHLAQIVFFRDRVPEPRRNLRSQQARTAENIDSAEGLLFLEYAKLGDLRGWLDRLGSNQNHLPPEALWRLFDCLVKACNAMEYAPFSRAQGNQGNRAGPPLREDIGFRALDEKQPGWEGVVHFDLDPKNILVVGYDQQISNDPREPDHTQMPKFQLGDFGIARTGNWCWRHTVPPNRPNMNPLRVVGRRHETWGQREMAKAKWFLPEQFSSAWDQYELGPDEGAANEWLRPEWYPWLPPFSGPGRYSYKSNIWHIGMNMFCTLLLQEPDFPPVAGRMRSAEPPQWDPVPMRHQRWTYGYRLIADDAEGQGYRQRFTPLLCETIAKCLMAKQEHRPNLIELQRIITGAISNGPARLPDAVRNFFGDDAPPAVPRFLDYTRFDLETMDPFDPYPGVSDSPIPATPPPPRGRRRRRGRHAPLEDRAYRP